MLRSGIAFGLAGLFVIGAAEAAVRIKPLMRDWKADLTTAEQMISAGAVDSTEIKRILDAYVSNTNDIVARISGADGADAKARFQKFAATATKAETGAMTPGALKPAFADLRGQCRSCHDSLN